MNAALSSNVNSVRDASIQRYHLKNRDRSIGSNLKLFAKQKILVSVRDMILMAMGIIIGGLAGEQIERFTHVAVFCACIFLLSNNKREDRVIVEKMFHRNKPQHQTRRHASRPNISRANRVPTSLHRRCAQCNGRIHTNGP